MKVEPNEACQCGSGKKYKKCCGQDRVNALETPLRETQSSLTQLTSVTLFDRSSTPMRAECDQLVALFQGGHYAELDILARKLIEQYPHFGFTWKIWGVSLQLRGKVEALHALQKASALLPDDFGAHGNVGNALLSLGRHDEAITIYRRVLIVKSDFAEAYYNLGIALKAKEQIDGALLNYQRALAINPDYADAHYNLGNVLRDLERFDDAVESYRQALRIKPNHAEAHYNLSFVLQALGRQEDAVSSCRLALLLKPDYAEALYTQANALSDLGEIDPAIISYQRVLFMDTTDLGLRAASWLAVLYYLKADLVRCKDMLRTSLEIREINKSEKMPARSYRNYVAKIVEYLDKETELREQTGSFDHLYVIGESHSFSAHGVLVDYRGKAMRCAAQWIQGVKQWHLGNDLPNRFKRRFEFVLGSLPPQSTALLIIGEIDCRPDEGIVNVCKKYPERSLKEIAQTTVSCYLNYVARINDKYQHQLIICGVPATNYPLDALSPELAKQLVDIILQVNSSLKAITREMGMDFLDVYDLTNTANGIASGSWHIDTFHLVPRAISMAFREHCKSPDS